MIVNNREYQLVGLPNFPDYVTLERVVEPGYFDVADDEDMQLVETWCIEHQCGKRSGHASFYFESKEAMTMFKLRWA